MDEWGEVGGDVVLKGVGGIGVVYWSWDVIESWWCCVVLCCVVLCPKLGLGAGLWG